MTTTLERPLAQVVPPDGGLPARRAVIRWAWRLFRREWRQQFLILALIIVAVAATIVGSAVSINTRQAADFGFGTAQDSVTLHSTPAQAAISIGQLRRQVGEVEVIDNETLSIPGSINTYQLRAENPRGPYSQPMLSLLSGHYPSGPEEVAVTSGVASAYHLKVGDQWDQGGTVRRVVGTVENPQNLLDQFALVAPGQVTAPTQVTALFDAEGASLKHIGVSVQTPGSVSSSNVINPETISLAALVLGMLLIALVAIGGFTVLAQRRLRSIGMLESLGATDRHVSLVVCANGVVVGAVGGLVGFLLGLVVWLAYRPSLEQSAHHLIGVWAIPWLVVVLAMALAVVATYFAASRPARAITKVPIVAALSGRPVPPRQVHRSAFPGIVLLVVAFVVLGLSGSSNGNGGGMAELLLGLVLLVPGMILLAPFLLTLAARLGRHAPIAPRLALRDLARYRARSGSGLAAIGLGVLIAVIVSLAAAARYGNVLDYAGPNLSSDQIALHADTPPPAGTTVVAPGQKPMIAKAPTAPLDSALELGASANRIATALGARVIALQTPDATINYAGTGRNWDGAIYVATPELLKAFGISPSQINPEADVLTARPGLSSVSGLSLSCGTSNGGGGSSSTSGGPGGTAGTCTGAIVHPVIQEMSALPSGTSAPNTVVTEHAERELHLQTTTRDWLVQGSQPFTASQISGAQLTASTSQLSVESKDDQPTSSQVINWATAFGIVLALGILAMSVGLIRSETETDLRTLTAAGAGSFTRRTLTAVTAGTLALLGALLGTIGGYIALAGWLRDNSLNGGISALGNVPVTNLLMIVVGLPLVATALGWLLAGRAPSGVARQPMD